MTNEKDKALAHEIAWQRHTQNSNPLESRIFQALTAVRKEETEAAIDAVRACSTRDELHPDISITVSEFKSLCKTLPHIYTDLTGANALLILLDL